MHPPKPAKDFLSDMRGIFCPSCKASQPKCDGKTRAHTHTRRAKETPTSTLCMHATASRPCVFAFYFKIYGFRSFLSVLCSLGMEKNKTCVHKLLLQMNLIVMHIKIDAMAAAQEFRILKNETWTISWKWMEKEASENVANRKVRALGNAQHSTHTPH